MAQFGCGGPRCTCLVTAGPGVVVTGNGSAGAPYVVEAGVAPVSCDDVRPCLSAGPGATYDPATGVIGAEPPVTGCGLTGDGTAGAPLAVATAAWPYDCPPEDSGTVVVCDADGVLRGEPRGQASFVSYSETRDYPDLEVPTGTTPTDVDTPFTLEVTNPDPCLPALVLVEREADVDFDLPVGAGAGYAQDTDEMVYLRNTGTTAIQDTHVQTTKLYQHTLSLAPGATATVNFPVRLYRCAGGATY
ncbi:hypothetical protein ACFV99_40830 [Streptomyces sp. NPDC059944]|uniref:hypothetical protein n=1 Tax=Streptomyces sp. NPDC059944 TaxID=3347011 RepID=UPI0036460EF5